MCCGSGVSVIYNNVLYYCFVYKVNILCYMLLFYHCSCNVTYILLMCWFFLVLCVTVLKVLNVSCSWFCFYIGGRMYVLLTSVSFLQCSEYWVMCNVTARERVGKRFRGFLETNPLRGDMSMDTGYGWSTGVSVDTDVLYNRIRIKSEFRSRAEAGSNTYTVALWVVGGDEKGSLEQIWLRVPLDSDPRITALTRTSSNCKRQTHTLVRESAPH
jgi:hypothetical protein